jgi:signal transduction histidine kinase
MTPRWRLFPKYALLIIALVGGLLIASGAVSIYFSWRENEQNLIALQAEKAQAAAARIEQYILDIEHQLGWTTLPALEQGSDPFEARRTEYQKLFRLAPAITEVAWLDPTGHEQVRLSRVAVNVDGSNDDYSQAAKFKVAKAGGTYYGPVYFRKDTEPYMTIARPAGLGGGVTVAEVNLKFVWDVVSRIRIGEKGVAYVVDEGGVLIAHPDISLVLRKTDLNALPQVAALRQTDAARRPPARGIGGDPVLSAHAAIAALHWTVFVESPEAEAFAPLYASILRAALLLGAGLLVSMVASFFVARALVRPLQALQEGAARIGAGELDRRIEVRTGDELESLAEQFNTMGTALKESYADLEGKVAARTAELSEALEQQTATATILRAISRSPGDVQPVFEAIATSAYQLLDRCFTGVLQRVGDSFHLVAMFKGEQVVGFDTSLVPLDPRANFPSRVFASGEMLHIPDWSAVELPPHEQRVRAGLGVSSSLMLPLLRGSECVAVLFVGRQQQQAFSEREIALAESFVDQASIAVENTRLFNETKEALERQTATAEILRVISGSITNTQPVFEAIVQSCRRLFGGKAVHLAMPRGDMIEDVAFAADRPGPKGVGFLKPWPLDRGSGAGTCILDARVVTVADTLEAARQFPRMHDLAIALGYRSCLFVPLLKEGEALGAISILRETTGSFDDKEIGLAQTFADQAVIAIENARLFNETKEALERQTATAEVLEVISSSVADTAPVFDKILDSCTRLFAATGLGIYIVDDAGMLQRGGFRAKNSESVSIVRSVAGEFPRPLAGSTTEIAIRERRVVHFPDVLADAGVPVPLTRVAAISGNFSIAFAPMLWEGRGVGAIQVSRDPPQPFTEKELTLLKTFADQAVIAIQNARFFNEIQAKSRELEQANRHKSEFLANMSHELRTPLNAIIGFSEVLSEKMFGEVNEKQHEYLLDIHSSGQHLLSLINDILDLSKIEAGRMELDLASTNLPMLLDNCTTLVRERASRQGLVLALEVEPGVADWVADVRKLKQVVINLLSNAVKFTPAGGRVTLRVRRLEGAVEIAVVDTGVGIAADQQALVFEEFRQAGGDYLRKSEGTGLGLSLARRFVELHGGTIRVESAPGRGSTFAFILPERVVAVV